LFFLRGALRNFCAVRAEVLGYHRGGKETTPMKTNVGTMDRLSRAVIGLIILGVGFDMRSPWALIGLLPLASSVLAFCPLYVALHINTCEPHKE
jgi:hypothetical protein